jgi:predicted small secreted protein
MTIEMLALVVGVTLGVTLGMIVEIYVRSRRGG